MRRTFIGGLMLMLLLSAAIFARSRTAAHEKPDALVFVFLRVDRESDIAVLRPMIAPDIGVQLEAGPRQLKPGTVLQCKASRREHEALVENQIAKITDLALDCSEYKFLVKSLDFHPAGK